MEETFIEYLENARKEFVTKTWESGLNNSAENRVIFEDILIAYDQMLEKIKEYEIRNNESNSI